MAKKKRTSPFGPRGTGRSPSSTSFLASLRRLPINFFKVCAAFVCAPVLAFSAASNARNPIRRWMARAGIVVGLILAGLTFTFAWRVMIALALALKFGPLIGLGFILGTYLSMTLSLGLFMFVFNGVCLLFLQMSREDVLEYLGWLAE